MALHRAAGPMVKAANYAVVIVRSTARKRCPLASQAACACGGPGGRYGPQGHPAPEVELADWCRTD